MRPVEPPYDPEIATMLAKWMPPGSDLEPLALFRLLAVHRELAQRCWPMASFLLGRGLLPPHERELVIQRVTGRCGAEYEWGVHAAFFGPRVGLDHATLVALATDDTPDLPPRDAAIVAAVDEVLAAATVGEPALQRLREHGLGDAEVLELLHLTGWYRTLASVIRTAQLPPEPWAARLPEPDAPAAAST